MKNKKAFTLIELLVVVLIIGILSAIALPQYQMAVAKSRFVQLKVLVNAIAQAEQAYFMANGTYTNDIDKLDVSFPAPVTSTDPEALAPGARRYFFDTDYACSLIDEKADGLPRFSCQLNDKANTDYYVQYMIAISYGTYAGYVKCGGYSTSYTKGKKICSAETGKSSPDTESYGYFNYYY